MDIKSMQSTWNAWGRRDPLWSILADPAKKGNRWQLDEFFATGVTEISTLLRHLDAIGARIGRDQALDFGCGVGRLTQALAKEFAHVTGVDIAPSMLEQAERYNRNGERCRFLLNESADLSAVSADSVDLVYSNITLEHCEPVFAKGYIREFLRVIRPGGVAAFHVLGDCDPASAPDADPLRTRVRSLLPAPALQGYRLVRDQVQPTVRKRRPAAATAEPPINCYGIPKPEVLVLIQEQGGRLLDIETTRPNAWWSHMYYVTK